MPPSQKSLSPGKICLLYVSLSSGLWILFSEPVIHYLIGDHELLLRLSTWKVWFLVLFAIVFFYFFMGRIWQALKGARQEIIRTAEKQHQQLDAVKRQEGFYLRIYDSVAEGVILQHISGQFFNANSVACALLGTSLSDMQKSEFLTQVTSWIDNQGEPFSWKAHASNVLAAAQDSEGITNTLKRFDPVQSWLHLNSVLLRNTQRTALGGYYIE